jgi:hypothetical protein
MISYEKNKLKINGKTLVLDYPIKKTLEMNGLIFVLLDPDSYTLKYGQFSNLTGYEINGSFLWTAELPSNYPGDRYHNIYIEEGKLKAHSPNYTNCEIDMVSGKVLSSFYNK